MTTKILIQVRGGLVDSVKVNGQSEVLIIDWDSNELEPVIEGMTEEEVEQKVQELSYRMKESRQVSSDGIAHFM